MAKLEDRVDTLENVLSKYITHSEKEMSTFKVESREETRVLKEEMRVFIKETRAFEAEMREDRREMNRQWGNLSNKLGTIVEDIVVPAIRPALRKYFEVDPLTIAPNIRRRVGSEEYQVDALAVSDKLVFWVEAKSSPRSEHVKEILEKAGQFRRFFPEYEDKEMIIIMAGISFPSEVV